MCRLVYRDKWFKLLMKKKTKYVKRTFQVERTLP